jgi:hypothetical protein
MKLGLVYPYSVTAKLQTNLITTNTSKGELLWVTCFLSEQI